MLACAAIGEIALAEIPSIFVTPPPGPTGPPPGHGDYPKRKPVRPIWDIQREKDAAPAVSAEPPAPQPIISSPSFVGERIDMPVPSAPYAWPSILPPPPEPTPQARPPRITSYLHSRTTEDDETALATVAAAVAAQLSTLEGADSITAQTSAAATAQTSTLEDGESGAANANAIATAQARHRDQDERSNTDVWTDDDDALALLMMDQPEASDDDDDDAIALLLAD